MSRRIIDTNGAAIQVVEAGAGDPALVFLHYWGGSSRTWQDVIDQLGGRPRSIALDQRGWAWDGAQHGVAFFVEPAHFEQVAGRSWP